MTATERLRALLDERSVEWMGTIYTKPTQGHPTNTSLDEKYHNAAFIEYFDGNVLRLFDITPEQAIEATLGQGTCHTVAMDCFGNPPYNQSGLKGNSTACGCSECGTPWSTMGVFRGNQLKHNFKACPICGRMVVES